MRRRRPDDQSWPGQQQWPRVWRLQTWPSGQRGPGLAQREPGQRPRSSFAVSGQVFFGRQAAASSRGQSAMRSSRGASSVVGRTSPPPSAAVQQKPMRPGPRAAGQALPRRPGVDRPARAGYLRSVSLPTREVARPAAAAGLAADPLLREIARRLAAGLDAERVVLFGSRARGEADAESDFDLLVVAPVSGSQVERMIAGRRLLDGLGIAADVFVFAPDEIERYRQWPGHVIRIALREGVTLHDRG